MNISSITKLFALAFCAILIVAGNSMVNADDDDDDGHRAFSRRQPGVAPAADATYRKECGSCHMAYQPGLLPARSWKQIMTSLDSHFGDNAELDPATHAHVLRYLEQNSADTARFKRSQRIMSSLSTKEVPLRISETAYIAGKHRELPSRAVGPSAKVKSLSQCDACHANAEKGDYSEHGVTIPGFGRW